MSVKSAIHDYTDGLSWKKVPGLLGHEATEAYHLLTRDEEGPPEPAGKLRRLWHRLRLVFLGLSHKLSPPRRFLFGLSVVIALAGLQSNASGGISLAFWGALGLALLLALELADRVVVRDELEVARQLQHELLPSKAPEIPGITTVFSYRTANEIGGDYFDVIPLPGGRVVLTAGDASGHGMAAGLVMAVASSTLKLGIDLDPRPEAVVDLVHRALWRTGGRRAFMTLFYGLYDPVDGRLDYVSAAHPYPLLRRCDGEILELGTPSLPLGTCREIKPRPGSITLAPGDLLLLYSDGIPEAVDRRGEAFGFERLREALRPGGSPREVHDRIVRHLEAFVADQPALDDRSLVVLALDDRARL